MYVSPCAATVDSSLHYMRAIKDSASAACNLWTLPKYYANLQQICRALYRDLRNLRDPTQMLINLLKTRRPASALHFHLTFQRAGSVLPRLAFASLHPHGSSSCSLTFSAVQRAATWLRNWGFPYQIPQVPAHWKACPAHLPPPPPLPSADCPSLCPAMFLFPVWRFRWPHLFLFLWIRSIARMPHHRLPHRSCSRRSVTLVAASCKIASLNK